MKIDHLLPPFYIISLKEIDFYVIVNIYSYSCLLLRQTDNKAELTTNLFWSA